MEEKLEPFTRHGTVQNRIEVSADEILNAIVEGRDVDITKATIIGILDLGRIRDQLEQNCDELSIIRVRIKIHSSEIDEAIRFGFAQFIERVSFEGNWFKEAAHFAAIQFETYVSFEAACFDGEVWFTLDHFEGVANFAHAEFYRDADFGYARFKHDVYFHNTQFAGDVNFRHAQFHGNTLSFKRGSFGANVYFNGVLVHCPALLEEVQLYDNTVVRGLWNEIMLPISWATVWTLGRAVFILCERLQKIDRKYKTTELSQFIVFTSNIWKRIRRYRLPVTRFIGFNTSIMMDGSSNPRLKRYIDDEQWIESWRTNPKGKWWREPVFRFWELTSHCGRSFGLWLFWALAIATAFAGIYSNLGSKHIAFNVEKFLDEGVNPDFWSYLYYSIVTFTTLGFGDIVPLSNPGRLVVGIEVFLGYLMLGGLISIFAVKFARRS